MATEKEKLVQRRHLSPKSRFTQGFFRPKNPHKYVGDVTKIQFMSSYELETMNFFDGNQRVLHWSSEEIAIPYLKPTDNKVHKYWPDYWVEYINKDGEIIQEIIEVKPASQTRLPRANSKHKLYESMTLAVNMAKWSACEKWCKERGILFRIITEKSIFR